MPRSLRCPRPSRSLPGRAGALLAPLLAPLVLLLVLLPPRAADAQIVDVLRDAKVQEQGWSGSFSFPLEWFTGNTRLIRLGGTGIVRWRHDPHTLFLLVEGDYGRAGGEQVIGRILEHLRYRYAWLPWLEQEVYVQHAYDPFRRMALRVVAGSGPRFRLVQGERGGLWLGTAVMSEWERYEDDGLPDGDTRLQTWRWSSHLQASLRLGDRLSLAHTTFVQPAFDDFSDLRVSSRTTLRAVLVGTLFMEPAFLATYDARAPQEVESVDTELKLSVGFSF